MSPSRTPAVPWVAVIGDQIDGFEPQTAIAAALGHSADEVGVPAPDIRWFATDRLLDDGPSSIEGASLVWCAPGSPYRSMEGALLGIRWAREHRVAFLGTCAGFQHGVIEVARNVLGRRSAFHAEYGYDEQGDDELFIDELLCALVGQTMGVDIVDDGLATIYGRAHVDERYYCRFGLRPEWRQPLHDAGLRVAGVDSTDGDVRIMALADHPFFVLTLFVPQCSSNPSRPHPLVTAFLRHGLAEAGRTDSDGSDDRVLR